MDVSQRSSRCGDIMTEPTDQTATIPQARASVATRGTRRSAALERGFPSGKLLLGLAALIILLQGIAAWKVVHLEQERAAVARSRAILDKDRQGLDEDRKVHGALLRGNRSASENRHHAAACTSISQAGRRDGAASPRRAAS